MPLEKSVKTICASLWVHECDTTNSMFVMRNRARQIIFSALAIGGSLLLTITLIEAALRVFSGWLPVELHQLMQADPNNYGVAHPYIGHLHRPNNALAISGRDFRAVHHTDGHGFRNSWPWPKTAEFVVLGDSVTFGQGVEDTQAWPAILAQFFPAGPLIHRSGSIPPSRRVAFFRSMLSPTTTAGPLR